MPRYTDPKERFAFEVPTTWTALESGGWRSEANFDTIKLYDHTHLSADISIANHAAGGMRPRAHSYPLEATRRSLMLDACPAERVGFVGISADGELKRYLDYYVDLGDVCLTIQIWQPANLRVSTVSELDAAMATFQCLRDPMQHLTGDALAAYRNRTATWEERLADPSTRDFLDQTIAEIADGSGVRALARKREINALRPQECHLNHPRVGEMRFDPKEENWYVNLPLVDAPAACAVLMHTQPQPTFAAEREAALSSLDVYADQMLAIADRWTLTSLVGAICEDIEPLYNTHWRDEDETPDPLPVSAIVQKVEKISGLAMHDVNGPTLSLYLSVAEELFYGHQIEAVMKPDGSISLCGLAG